MFCNIPYFVEYHISHIFLGKKEQLQSMYSPELYTVFTEQGF